MATPSATIESNGQIGQEPRLPQNVHIKPYSTDEHYSVVADLWKKNFPGYYVNFDHLKQLLDRPNAFHFVICQDDVVVGFCAAYVVANSGNITVIVVEPEFQGRGYGTALLKHVKEHLEIQPEVSTLMIGGHFPRFWPGVPRYLPDKDQSFFLRRGFREGESSRDLYQDLSSFKAPDYILDRAKSAGITFAPLTPSGFEECLIAQRANFSTYGGWVQAYETLHQHGLDHEVMVAFDASGKQVGWTLMLSPSNPFVKTGFAFLPIAGGGDGDSEGKTGLIGCVGVSADARKGGVGLAMLCAAMEDMKNRDIQGVFVDWVGLKGWYEKVGFQTWREYRSFKL